MWKFIQPILIPLLVVIIITEILFRIFNLGYNFAPINPDNIRHHSQPKNFTFKTYSHDGEFGGHLIYYDNMGYRVPYKKFDINDQKATRRIAFLGDSMTEALQVEWDKTFVEIINKKFPESIVRNFGTSSYSTIIYLVQLLGDVKEFRPTDVVIQLFRNDLPDDHRYFKKANSQNIKEIRSINGGKQKILIRLYRYSYFARNIRTVQQIIKYKYFPKKGGKPDLTNPGFDKIGNKDDLTTMIIDEIENLSENLNFNLYFLFIPSKQNINPINLCCENDSEYKIMKNFIKKENFIDISDYFANSTQYPYFKIDMHMTEHGHKVVAESIYEFLKND